MVRAWTKINLKIVSILLDIRTALWSNVYVVGGVVPSSLGVGL